MKIEIEGLKKSFGKHTLFENLSMTIESGLITGIAGRNGAGKTTLMQTIATILKEDCGSIRVDGKDLRKNYNVLEDIIYIPDKFDYFKNYRIKRAMSFYSTVYKKFDKQKCRRLIEEMKFDINKDLGSLSKGQLTVVGTIFGLSSNADIIMIDEPYDGVDVINAKKMDKLLIEAREEGRGVLISSHQLDKLEMICDTIYVFEGMNVHPFSLEGENEIGKYQVVMKEPVDIQKLEALGIATVNSLGRVYQMLYKGSEDEFRKIVESEGAVQYDRLSTRIEDIMLWNDREEQQR